MITGAHFILYVSNQDASTEFYRRALGVGPRLYVPGMTEFGLPGGAVLGLMPESGIRRLLGERLPDPAEASGIPRAELYLLVEDARAAHERALGAGARELSPVSRQSWGHEAGYSLDQDGHVLAFARPLDDSSGSD
jgi:catechol 2,3-dioxygenase-like lactoylglutathione lyase family enzyme